MYYVMHMQENLIQTIIHLSTNDHSVVEVCSREIFYEVKSLVEEEVSCTSRVTVLAIALVASKNFLFKHLLNKDGEGPVEVFKGDKLQQVMDKSIMLFFPKVQNLIASFKYWPRNKGYVSNILTLKTNSGYSFIHDSYFLGQHNGGESVYIQDVYAWK